MTEDPKLDLLIETLDRRSSHADDDGVYDESLNYIRQLIEERDAWQKQHAGTLAVLEVTRRDLEATKTLYRNARQQIRDLEEDLERLEARR